MAPATAKADGSVVDASVADAIAGRSILENAPAIADAADGAAPDATVLADSNDFDVDHGDGEGDALAVDAADQTDAADASDAGDSAPSDAGDCPPGSSGEPTELRCTGLYADWATKTVAANVRQYDPGLHLWSDGAVKTRWIYLPPDPASDAGPPLPIDTSDMDEWVFPVGTKFWKEFALGGKRIETRLLWKQGATTWYRTTYRWSADGSSAPELVIGELDADGTGYEVPDQSMCSSCHSGRADGVLGFEAVSLSSADAGPITMQTLATEHLITSVPDAAIVIPGNTVDVAALGYLHANCGTACHNSGSGVANLTGFRMRLDVATLGSVQSTDTWTTGVNQATVFYAIPGDPSTMRLVPYDAGASCAYYRMDHRIGVDDAGPRSQMPPIDTHRVDEAGTALIAQWIGQGCQ